MRFVLMLLIAITVSVAEEEVVIEKGMERRVLGGVMDIPQDWAATSFDDRRWKDSLEPGTTSGFIRYRFNVEDIDTIDRAAVRMRYRDGAVVYLNGAEWLRVNMPPGFVDATTEALGPRSDEAEAAYEVWEMEAPPFELGGNVLAIMVRAQSGNVIDFDVELALKRGMPAAGSVVVASMPSGREISWKNDGELVEATAADWKVTAFAFEEIARTAYEAGDWAGAAEGDARGLLAYAFAERGASVLPELKRYLLDESAVAREFLELLSPSDRHEDVYRLLNLLYSTDRGAFEAYPRLAMAIALVYDEGPPRRWPHGQVAASALPRQLPEPRAAFRFWVDSEKAGKTLYSMDRLMIEELKYVVDVAAPLEELRWAQDNFRLRTKSLGKLYGGIRYDMERYLAGQNSWQDTEDYQLSSILARGGICVDQSYFMTQVAKAHGVPCVSVTGVVEDGSHAWVGYMEEFGAWNFEAGRSAESTYVAGRLYDPQTWRRSMESELAFLKERLAFEPRYQRSLLHSRFAIIAEREGDDKAVIARATAAVKEDNRNLEAWEILIRMTKEIESRETLCRNAAKAFRDYPDLEAGFLRRLITLLRERNRAQEADGVQQSVIRRYRSERPDLALSEAERELVVAMKEEPIDVQVRLYRRQVATFERAGLITAKRLVEPFVTHLAREGEFELARKAIEYASKRLVVSIPEQLERQVTRLEEMVDARSRRNTR